jgi:hypothetical protein
MLQARENQTGRPFVVAPQGLLHFMEKNIFRWRTAGDYFMKVGLRVSSSGTETSVVLEITEI